MKMIVDTCVWSAALRRGPAPGDRRTRVLSELIRDSRVQMLGPIRQEILSGIREESQFENMKKVLSAFDDLPLDTTDYEMAAHYYNVCARKGIQGSNTDFLICAASARRDLPVYTFDKDFVLFQKFIPILLFQG